MSSLFIRIYLSTLVFLILAFLLTTYVVNSLIPSQQLIENAGRIEQTLIQHLKNKSPKDWPREIERFDVFQSELDISLISIEDLSQSEYKRLKQSKTRHIVSDKKIGNLYTVYHFPDTDWLLKIQETDYQNMTRDDWLDIFLPILLIFSTLAFGLFLLIRKLTKPIEHLTIVAKKLGKGELDIRARTDLPKPISILATGFNNMADQLHETIQEQQILIGAIPHELRSPLGRIRFALDLTRNKETIEELREHIEKIDGYVDDMQETVDDILELDRLQNKHAIEIDNLALCPLIQSLEQFFQQNNPTIKFTLSCELSTKPQGNAPLLKHAVQNILENAIRYTHSEIHIRVWQENHQTLIQIDDDGKGIPEKKLSEVFIPFYTSDSSRNRTTGGIGLGLSLVKIIMKKQGGDVVASQSLQGGACFRLFW